MKYGILSALVLVGLVFTISSMNQNIPQSSDQPGTVSSKVPDTEKRIVHEHSADMTTPEQNEGVSKTPSDTVVEIEYISKYGALPTSLQGTRLDGDLIADSEGKFLILPSTKKRFDYFLSAVSEEGLETAIGRIEENINQTLPPEAAEEALTILYSYINYKKSLQSVYKKKPGVPENSDQVADIRFIMETRKALRRKYMTPDVVNAYFGDQELYDDFSLKCLELHHDKTLTSEEKQNKQRDLEKILPEKIRDRRKRETETKNLYFYTTELAVRP